MNSLRQIFIGPQGFSQEAQGSCALATQNLSIPENTSDISQVSCAGGVGLYGTFPRWLGSSSTLRVIGIVSGLISGTIQSLPPRLETLAMMVVPVSGTLPMSWNGSSSFVWLGPGPPYRPLSGTFPPSMPKIKSSSVMGTKLSGTLPLLGRPLIVFQYPFQSETAIEDGVHMGLSGTLPDLNDVNNPKLANFFMKGHPLMSGTIPSKVFSLVHKELRSLLFSKTRLSGTLSLPNITIWESFTHASQFQALGIDACRLSGTLPSNFGSYRTLVESRLHNNSLSGTIAPLGWGMNLRHLFLFSTDISGTLPSNFGNSVGKLLNMMVGSTGLSGSLPQSFVNITSIFTLDMSNCHIRGDLANVVVTPDLIYVHLQDNALSGTLCTWAPCSSTNHCSAGTVPPDIFSYEGRNIYSMLLFLNRISGAFMLSIDALAASYASLSGCASTRFGHVFCVFLCHLF